MNNLIHNYGSSNKIVNKKLCNYLLIEKNAIALNGAAQLFPFLKEKFKDKIGLIPNPTFGEYHKIFKNYLTYSDKPGYDIVEIEEKIKKVDVIIIVNPNNPSGNIFLKNELINLIKNNLDKIFIIDESFLLFSNNSTLMEDLLENNITNVLILTSLSKTLGIPGLRLGYTYTLNNALFNEINNWLPIWNLNSFAEFFLEIILKHRNSLEKSIIQTKLDRQNFINELSKYSWAKKVFQSEGNFILLELQKVDEVDLMNYLLEKHKIFVKSVSEKFNSNSSFFRLAVRLPEENQLLISGINNYFNE